MSKPYVYDKSKYHMTGAKGGAPSWEAASGCALSMLRWFMDHKLVSNVFLEESPLLTRYQNGDVSLFEVYERDWDLALVDDMISEEGNAFGRQYFDYNHGRFIEDLWATLKLSNHDYPVFSEETYARMKPLIDSRYTEWKAGN